MKLNLITKQLLVLLILILFSASSVQAASPILRDLEPCNELFVETNPDLSVTVYDADNDAMTVTFYYLYENYSTILRPTEDSESQGDGSGMAVDEHGALEAYNCVDEVTVDYNSTYIDTSAGFWVAQDFWMENSTLETGDILVVYVYWTQYGRAIRGAPYVRINNNENSYGPTSLSWKRGTQNQWTDRYRYWIYNPSTNKEWNWSAIDDMEAGIRWMETDSDYRITQFYVEVISYEWLEISNFTGVTDGDTVAADTSGIDYLSQSGETLMWKVNVSDGTNYVEEICLFATQPSVGVTLTSPTHTEFIDDNTVTFNWTTDYFEPVNDSLWLWKNDGVKELYNINSTDSIALGGGTYYAQVVAYADIIYGLSDKILFTVVPTGKYLSATIQPDQTSIISGETLSGNIVITNEGEADSYEVYWYLFLDNKESTSGSVAVDTTTAVTYSFDTSIDMESGTYTLQLKAYDKDRDNPTAELIGQDSIQITVRFSIVTVSDNDIASNSLIYDTPRYEIDLSAYKNVTRIKVPTVYDYSWLFFSGSKSLDKLKLFEVTGDKYQEVTITEIGPGIYEFADVSDNILVVPNPSLFDCTWIYNI